MLSIFDTIFSTAVISTTATLVLCLSSQGVIAGDWPQILGPHRTGIADPDEQLADAWPAAGPREAWRREVGSGYAGVAVVDEKPSCSTESMTVKSLKLLTRLPEKLSGRVIIRRVFNHR